MMTRSAKQPIKMTLIQFGFAIAVILSIVLIAQMGGCKPYRKEISRKSLLSKLDQQQRGEAQAPRPTVINEIFAVPGGKIRTEDEDGNVTLYAKSIKHLMNHIIYALENDERELFTEQILSQITKDEFIDRGMDPGIAFDELVKRRRDIYRMFNFMPMGESTPGLYIEPIGENLFRLAVSRAGHQDLLWIGIDVSFEDLNYKLRWFVR
ncbi:MAG: hypothetical protein JJ974_02390 [Phycisphaerales bacterium]|nr:hypothetical protein [Phycisphaerales bacterium]